MRKTTALDFFFTLLQARLAHVVCQGMIPFEFFFVWLLGCTSSPTDIRKI